MYKRMIGEEQYGVSPVIAIILMVAITVVLAGIVYVWVSQLSSTSDEGLAYIGFDKTATEKYWEVTIGKVEGSRIPLDEINLFIRDINGIVQYKKTTSDSNPKPFVSSQSKVYPIAANSSGVISVKTSSPVTASDDPNDYRGAIYVIIDIDNDGVLNTGDTIRIYNDFDGDGIKNIHSGEFFKINDLGGSNEYLKCHL